MLNFVLCDDNKIVLEKFSKMLNLIFERNDFCGNIALATTNPEKAYQFIKENNVDAVILDIDFNSEINGIELAQKIRDINKKIYIIFETAHLEYLLLAYKCKTFDYLTKPISLNNLEETISRLFNDVTLNTSSKSFIKIGNSNLINANSVFFIEKNKTQLIFKCKSAEYSTYSSFNKILPNLPSTFIRCHKSFIVNVSNIQKIDNSIIYFDKNNQLTCSIGQVYKKKFMEVLKNESNTTNDAAK